MRSRLARPLSSELLSGTIMNHLVLWVALYTMLIAYVCLLNPWCRNLLPGRADRLTIADTSVKVKNRPSFDSEETVKTYCSIAYKVVDRRLSLLVHQVLLRYKVMVFE